MKLLTTWICSWLLVLGVLLLCGVLDAPPEQTACVVEIKDGFGHKHVMSGKIYQVSVD